MMHSIRTERSERATHNDGGNAVEKALILQL